MPEAGVLAGADQVLDAGVDPVACAGVGALAAPASRVLGQVRHPQGVTPPVAGLEQGELGAGVRPLAAGEDPHARRPGLEPVAARARSQQPGQLGDVRFLDPAGPVAAPVVPAGRLGAALADLPPRVDRGFPRGARDQRQRDLLPFGQRPADRVGELAPAATRELVQAFDQVMAGARAVAGDHELPAERRRERRDRLVQEFQVVLCRVRPGRARPHHPRQRLAQVVTFGQDGMMVRTP